MARTRAELSITYHEIARRLLLKQDTALIAQSMCLPEESIKRIMRRPSFTDYLKQLEDKAYGQVDQRVADRARNMKEELEAASWEAFDKLKALLSYASAEALQVNIAQDLMDRAGHGRTQKVSSEVAFNVDSITADVLLTSLRKEEAARKALEERGAPALVKAPIDLDHPVVKKAQLQQEQDDREHADTEPSK